jgi:hypothetical protein
MFKVLVLYSKGGFMYNSFYLFVKLTGSQPNGGPSITIFCSINQPNNQPTASKDMDNGM